MPGGIHLLEVPITPRIRAIVEASATPNVAQPPRRGLTMAMTTQTTAHPTAAGTTVTVTGPATSTPAVRAAMTKLLVATQGRIDFSGAGEARIHIRPSADQSLLAAQLRNLNAAAAAAPEAITISTTCQPQAGYCGQHASENGVIQ